MLTFLKIYLGYCIFRQGVLFLSSLVALSRVEGMLNKKLFIAASLGMTKWMDKLIDKGADVNYKIKKNKNMTPLSWLIMRHHHHILIRRGFEHLLKRGADPYVLNVPDGRPIEYDGHGNIKSYNYVSVAFKISKFQHFFFLKKYLEIVKPSFEHIFSTPGIGISLLDEAAGGNMKENFDILLDYTAEHASIKQQQDAFEDLLLGTNTMGWDFIYAWLKKGLDYKVIRVMRRFKNSKNKPYLFVKLEDDGVCVSCTIIFQQGVDYVQKIVEFLKSKGHNIKLKMTPEGWRDVPEKYIIKNGKKILVNKTKSGKWKPFNRTWSYFFNVYLLYNLTRIKITRWLLTCKKI